MNKRELIGLLIHISFGLLASICYSSLAATATSPDFIKVIGLISIDIMTVYPLYQEVFKE